MLTTSSNNITMCYTNSLIKLSVFKIGWDPLNLLYTQTVLFGDKDKKVFLCRSKIS